jgi:hypothetical protein
MLQQRKDGVAAPGEEEGWWRHRKRRGDAGRREGAAPGEGNGRWRKGKRRAWRRKKGKGRCQGRETPTATIAMAAEELCGRQSCLFF